MDFLGMILLFLLVIIFSLFSWKDRSSLFFFRSLGMILSLIMIFSLNINWIFKAPFGVWSTLLFFLIISLVVFSLKFKFDKELTIQKNIPIKKNWILLVSFLLLSFAISFSYFEGDLRVPRYTTPDSAGHYLYMSRTAQNGILPIFNPNEIYPASGYNPVFIHHHDTYFPGGSAIFYFLSKMIGGVSISGLQLFNIIFYGLVFSYLSLIIISKNVFKNYLFLSFFLFTLLLGTIFSLLAASYTNQLYGLFFLIFFIDTFYEFTTKRLSAIVPTIALAGLITAYFYWLPLAVIFIVLLNIFNFKGFFSEKNYKKIVPTVWIMLAALGLNIGYILISLKANTLGLSTEGQFSLNSFFIDNTKFILPFALLNGYFIIKKASQVKKFTFISAFTFSSVLFSVLLIVGFFSKKVAGYALTKSFYLAIPTIWLLGISLFDKFVNNNEKLLMTVEKIRKFPIMAKNNLTKVTSFVLVFLSTLLIIHSTRTSTISIESNFFPLLSKNIDLILEKNKYVNISSAQIEFLDKLKHDYLYTLTDNRILIISPSDTSLWVFAYSGIWPRTYSLIPEGDKNIGIYSPMSFYSRDFANYADWLKNDKNHYLVIFDNKISNEWKEESGFNIENYEKIFSIGNNYLLKLNTNERARYAYDQNFNHDYFTHDYEMSKTPIGLPFSEEFISQENLMVGMYFKVNLQKKRLENYTFRIKNGKCGLDGEVIYQKEIKKEDLRNLENDTQLYISFNNPIEIKKGQELCYSLFQDSSSKMSAQSDAFFLNKNTATGKIIRKDFYLH